MVRSAVKSTIVRAGTLKREAPTEREDVLVLRALRDVNVPKFLRDDLPLFEVRSAARVRSSRRDTVRTHTHTRT